MNMMSFTHRSLSGTAVWPHLHGLHGVDIEQAESSHAERMLAETRRLLNEAGRIMLAQEERIQQLESLALTDELTGLMNRRGLMLALKRELAAARRSKQAHGILAMIDLDGFKQINDLWGHAAGDAYLQTTGEVLQNMIRPTDFVARLGGDEFAILLPRINAKNGFARMEQITQAFNTRAMHWRDTTLPLRASFGTATYGNGDTPDAILAAADLKLYDHKSRHTSRRKAL